MNPDLRDILRDWPYDPENSERNMRFARGADGRRIVQVREPLGIQQMEYEGRPDGERPMGEESWLVHYQKLARLEPDFRPGPEDAARLMQEGVLFYQRYLVLFQMEDWTGVVRDTSRNLAYFDFLKGRGGSPDAHFVVEQYRPYVMRMNAIARANIFLCDGRPDDAARAVRDTVEALEALTPVPTAVFRLEYERSLSQLRETVRLIENSSPPPRIEVLRRRQREAVAAEDFELAARLRDEIRSLESEHAGRT